MKFKFILPALTEAESKFRRPIKYSLFLPLGLATLATPMLEAILSKVTKQNEEPAVEVVPENLP